MDSSTEIQEVRVAKIVVTKNRMPTNVPAFPMADDLTFYPLLNDPLFAVFPEGHPLAAKSSITLPELFEYPLIIETPGCDNDIQHLLTKCPVRPNISYSFRDDTLIMSFVRNGLGVTISQELVLQM